MIKSRGMTTFNVSRNTKPGPVCSNDIARNSIEDNSEIFTTIPLKRDPRCLISDKTDRVFFPKIEQEIPVDSNNHDCFETFWIASFLHHEKDDNENLVSLFLEIISARFRVYLNISSTL